MTAPHSQAAGAQVRPDQCASPLCAAGACARSRLASASTASSRSRTWRCSVSCGPSPTRACCGAWRHGCVPPRLAACWSRTRLTIRRPHVAWACGRSGCSAISADAFADRQPGRRATRDAPSKLVFTAVRALSMCVRKSSRCNRCARLDVNPPPICPRFESSAEIVPRSTGRGGRGRNGAAAAQASQAGRAAGADPADPRPHARAAGRRAGDDGSARCPLEVSEAALYRHFASKAQMFEGLIEFIEQSVFTLVNQITERETDAACAGREGRLPSSCSSARRTPA